MWDDGAAGVVGPGHTAMRANIGAPGITSSEQVSATAEVDVVWEPEYYHRSDDRQGSLSDDTEPRRQRHRSNPTQ